MKLVTKARMAVDVLVEIARRENAGPVTIVSIHNRYSVSLSYLDDILGALRRHEIVRSIRGPRGGYRLVRQAAEISTLDIVTAVDASPGSVGFPRSDIRAGEWAAVGTEFCEAVLQTVYGILLDTSLQDLIDRAAYPGREIGSAKDGGTDPAALAASAPNSIFDVARYRETLSKERVR